MRARRRDYSFFFFFSIRARGLRDVGVVEGGPDRPLVVKDRARRKGEVWTILRRRRRAGGVALTVQSVELDDGVLFLPRGCASSAVVVRWTPGPRWMNVSMGRGLKALTREQQASGFG